MCMIVMPFPTEQAKGHIVFALSVCGGACVCVCLQKATCQVLLKMEQCYPRKFLICYNGITQRYSTEKLIIEQQKQEPTYRIHTDVLIFDTLWILRTKQKRENKRSPKTGGSTRKSLYKVCELL